MQEPVALLRSGATIMFGGNREASCGDLIYLYTLAAPRLTKKLMTVASEKAESVPGTDAEDAAVFVLEEDMLPCAGGGHVALCWRRTCCPVLEEDMLPCAGGGHVALCWRRTCCPVLEEDMLPCAGGGHVALCWRRTCCPVLEEDMLPCAGGGHVALCWRRTCCPVLEEDMLPCAGGGHVALCWRRTCCPVLEEDMLPCAGGGHVALCWRRTCCPVLEEDMLPCAGGGHVALCWRRTCCPVLEEDMLPCAGGGHVALCWRRTCCPVLEEDMLPCAGGGHVALCWRRTCCPVLEEDMLPCAGGGHVALCWRRTCCPVLEEDMLPCAGGGHVALCWRRTCCPVLEEDMLPCAGGGHVALCWRRTCCPVLEERTCCPVLEEDMLPSAVLRHGQQEAPLPRALLLRESLALTYTNFKQLDYLCSPLNRPFASLTSLTLKLRGCVDKSYLYDDLPEDCEDDGDEMFWVHAFDCPALQRLKLGRGKWNLQEEGWAEEYQSLRSLTLKHVDWSYVDVEYLGTVTPRLTEFTLYHSWSLDRPSSGPGGGGEFRFDLSKAQTVRFYFPQRTLTLFLTLSRSLKTFTAMAKKLVLSCKSGTPLALHHLSLYGQQRLVISSLHLASARVAYLNGPPKDHHSRNELDSPELSPESSPEFSWAEWLRTIAPTVEVLIVRHGVHVEGVDAEWSSLRSLGIVVESEERFEVDLKVEKRRDDEAAEAVARDPYGACEEGEKRGAVCLLCR
ncbi:unnamed protein product [Closterium sp. Naga37s-1]|nr:unnamed protein product [Closterium sp. Naga37s-1]